MKNKLKILILKLVLFLILSIPPANCVEQISESDIYSFAEHLFSQKDYYRAITEYKRLLFYFPKGKFTDDSKFKIAKSYQLGNKTSLAFNLFSDLEKEFEGKDLGLLADFESIECFYRARDYQTALNSYFKFIEAKKYKNFVDMATYRIGLSNLHLKNTEKAKNYFDSIEEQSKLHGLGRSAKNGTLVQSIVAVASISRIAVGLFALVFGREILQQGFLVRQNKQKLQDVRIYTPVLGLKVA